MDSFAKNAFATTIVRVLIMFLGFLISITVARYLGVEGQGVYSLALLLPVILTTFFNLGITSSTAYHVSKNVRRAREILGSNLIITIFTSLVSILIGVIVIDLFHGTIFKGVPLTYLYLSLFIIPAIYLFDFESHILVGLNKFRPYNILSFFQTLFLLMAILLSGQFFGGRIAAIIICQVGVLTAIGIITVWVIAKEVGGVLLKWDKEYILMALTYGFKTYLGSILAFISFRINLFLINYFLNPVAVGLYSIALKLSEGLWVLSTSTATVLFPQIAGTGDEEKKKSLTPIVYRAVMTLVLLIAIFIAVIAGQVVRFFYGDEFTMAVDSLRILLVGSVFISGWRILANDIIARGRPMINSAIVAVSTLTNIVLSVILIGRLGIIGAAWATTISYALILIISIVYYSRLSHNSVQTIICYNRNDWHLYLKTGKYLLSLPNMLVKRNIK